MNIGNLLYEARTRKRVTQQDISCAVGMTAANYSWVERGLGVPKVSTLIDMCWHLDIPFEKMAKAIRETEKERGIQKGIKKSELFMKKAFAKEER